MGPSRHSDAVDAPKTRSALTPACAVVAAAVVAAFVAFHVSATIPFDSDEANHANLALRQYQDLRDGRLLDFLRHSYRTGQFPFFHGWTVVPWFAALGATTFAARVAQCLHFVVGCAATAWAAHHATGGDRRAGGVAGLLFAASPALAVWSGLCMLETPGAAMSALALLAFAASLRAHGRAAARLDVATAGAVLATWFTKLNYGIWILPAIGLGYVASWAWRRDERRARAVALLRYVGVLVVVLGAWYSTASARAQFHGFLTNPAQAVSVVEDDPTFRLPGLSAANFTAYFGLVAGGFHVHWAIGAVVMLAAAAGAWRGLRERNAAIVAAAACVAWTWISLSFEFREYAMTRFVAPALPALWICAACGAAPLLRRAAEGRIARAAGWTLLAGGLVACALQVRAGLAPAREYEVDARFRPVFDHLAGTLRPPASVMVVNYTDHTSARTLAWELGSRPGGSYRAFDVTGLIAERIYESDRLFDAWLDTPRPWGDASWGGYVVEMIPGPRYFDAAVVVPATVALWRAAVERRGAGRLEEASRTRFDDLDLTVVVWRDLRPPPQGASATGGVR